MESTIEQTQCGIELVKDLTLVLERLFQSNLNITLSNPGQITKFHALKTPSITILQYLERVSHVRFRNCDVFLNIWTSVIYRPILILILFFASQLFQIRKYASCSTECFILPFIYIDRIIQRNKCVLTELNVHRVIITTVLVATKLFNDAYYNNAYYAKVSLN